MVQVKSAILFTVSVEAVSPKEQGTHSATSTFVIVEKGLKHE